MKKKILSLLLSVVMVVTMVSTMPFSLDGVSAATTIEETQPTKGDGTENNPYQISTAGELLWFMKAPQLTTGSCAELTSNIDAANLFESGAQAINNYQGVFNGNGYTIRNLSYYLFYNVISVSTRQGTVKNLTVKGTFDLQGYTNVGGICSILSGGQIIDCISDITIDTGDTSAQVGGICGWAENRANDCQSVILNCRNLGDVTGGLDVGGICGYSYGNVLISNCINEGAIVSNGVNSNASSLGNGDCVGGICGTVENYTGMTADLSNYITSGRIENCVNMGSVSASRLVGGICGESDWCATTNCTNIGSVTGKSYTGGIIGVLNFHTGEGTGEVRNCINNGEVTVAGDHGGNILGMSGTSNNIVVSNCYYQSGINDSLGGWDGADDDGMDEPRSKQQFISGELCYALNNGVTDGTQIWYQSLIKDTAPMPTGRPKSVTVYRVTQFSDCMNKKGTYTYSNTNENIPGTSHDYFDKDGICACGKGYQPAVLVSGVYNISNRGQLIWFAALVNGDTEITGGVAQDKSAKARLLADLSLDNTFSRIGTKASPYSGAFDGGGHKITVNYTVTNEFVGGLFDYVDGATIKNINITGNIATSNHFVGGLVGYEPTNVNMVTLENILSSVNITSSFSGDNTHGGIIAVADSQMIMKNCGYTGTITATNGTNCGGLCGWTSKAATFTNCYMAGIMSLSSTSGSATFCRGNASNISQNNCYYLNSYETVQGTQKSAAQFQSGEVTYLLNSGKTDGTQSWYQTCGTGLPALSGKTVYGGYVNCGSAEKTYSNSSLNVTLPGHTFSAWTDNGDGTHSRTCSVCGTVETEAHNDICTDNGDGTHTVTCSDCGKTETASHTFSAWADNGDGTHSRTCSVCEKTEIGEHTIVNGICSVCGLYEAAKYNDNGTTDILTDDYYEISNAGNLLWLSDFVNAGNTSVNAVMTENINFPGTRSWNTIKSYSGTFDGNGYKLYNIRNDAFIALLENGGTVKNLTLDGINFWATSNDCGGIVGTNSGVIENCVVNSPYIQCSSWAGFGGVAGSNSATGVIRKCAVIGGTLMLRWGASNNPGGNSMGGVCGINSGKIENCYLYNTNLSNGVTHGAIVFKANTGSTVENCYFNNPGYDATSGGTLMTTEQFKSGEVAALLQENCTETTWGQGDNNLSPILTSDETLVRRRVVFNYNDKTITSVLKYGGKVTLPKVETEDGEQVLYWTKADGSIFRATENVTSGLTLTAVMSYTKLVTVNNSDLTLDRTGNTVLSEAVQDGRTVKTYKDNFKNDNSLIVIETADGVVLSDTDIVGTGCVIKSLYEFDGETVIDYVTVIIRGDVNGDGLLDDNDYTLLKSNALTCTLEGAYFTAADIYKDGVIDGFDLYLMNLSKNSVNGKLKYKVSSEQTLAQLKAHFGEDIVVYNAQGKIVTDENTLNGAGTRVEYQRNGITISQLVEIVAS